MRVYYVPFPRRCEAFRAVKPGEKILSVYRKMKDSYVFGQEVFELSSGSRKRNIMAGSDLFMA